MINVVLVHIFLSTDFACNNDIQKSFLTNIHHTLFHCSTYYLLFISGYLFYKLNRNTYIMHFYKKKFAFVALPYIITSLFLIFISYVRHASKGSFISYIRTPYTLEQIFQYIIEGCVSIQFWFMPLICIIFLLCPFIKSINVKYHKNIFLLCIFMSFLFYRHDLNFYSYKCILISFNSLLHHIGIFFCGSLYFLEKKLIDTAIEINIKLIFSTCIIISVIIYIYISEGIFMMGLFEVQKYTIILCMLYLFNHCKINKHILKFLDVFAKYSFSIYLWHIFIIHFMGQKFYNLICDRYFANFYTKLLLLYIFCFITILTCCMILKKITGKYSRYIIGS